MGELYLTGRNNVSTVSRGEDRNSQKNTQGQRLLLAVLSSCQSHDFASSVQRAGLLLYQLPSILKDSSLTSALTSFARKPDDYRFQRAVVLSLIGADELPGDFMATAVQDMPRVHASLSMEYSNWYLCDDAEAKLKDAISETGVMALGEKGNAPSFLLKFNGKMSALCLEDTLTDEGKVFVRGNWYSPIDPITREELKKEFDSARGRTTVRGSWALMKSLQPSGGKTTEELLEEITQVASKIPPVYPNSDISIKGELITRKVYRVGKMEQG